MGCQEASSKAPSSFFLLLCLEARFSQWGGKCCGRANKDAWLGRVQAAGGPADPCGSGMLPSPARCTAYILSLQNSISGGGKWGKFSAHHLLLPTVCSQPSGCLSRPGFPARPFCSASILTTSLSSSQDPFDREEASLSWAHHVHHLLPPSHVHSFIIPCSL